MAITPSDAPHILADLVEEEYYSRKFGRRWRSNNDINSLYGFSAVQEFHRSLVAESARRAQGYSWGAPVGRPNVPTWKILDMAIDAKLEPGLALECAEFWGIDRADLG